MILVGLFACWLAGVLVAYLHQFSWCRTEQFQCQDRGYLLEIYFHRCLPLRYIRRQQEHRGGVHSLLLLGYMAGNSNINPIYISSPGLVPVSPIKLPSRESLRKCRQVFVICLFLKLRYSSVYGKHEQPKNNKPIIIVTPFPRLYLDLDS